MLNYSPIPSFAYTFDRMSRKLLTVIITLTTVSLIAAIATQLLWVRDALQLKEDQFNTKVSIALKSVVNQLMTSDEFPPADSNNFATDFFDLHEAILLKVNPFILDSLIKEELIEMDISDSIIYGVFEERTQVFILGNYSAYKNNILQSSHQVSLSCLCQYDSYILSAYFPREKSIILNDMIILPIMSGLFLLVLILSFIFTLYSLVRQKRLSELKSDFVNNMTHEFKTPIATISISSEMLNNEDVIQNPEKVKKYAQVIYQENSRLKTQVEKVLQIALMDREDFNLKLKSWDVHDLIQQRMDHFMIQVHDRDGEISARFNARRSIVNIDKEHFSNIINNLLDNANKYSPQKPFIEITTSNSRKQLRITIKDHGIGIKREHQAQIFKKFHRLQSGDIHDVKGFGLGLFYVKTMMEEMGGRVDLKSEPGKGTSVTLVLSL